MYGIYSKDKTLNWAKATLCTLLFPLWSMMRDFWDCMRLCVEKVLTFFHRLCLTDPKGTLVFSLVGIFGRMMRDIWDCMR